MGLFNSSSTVYGDNPQNVPKHIKGITCDVRNCVYHDGDIYCTAERIAVGPTYATNCADTVCATFRQKQR